MRKSRAFDLAAIALLSGAWLLLLRGDIGTTDASVGRLPSRPSLRSRDAAIDTACANMAVEASADIPARGWYAGLQRVGQQFIEHRLMYEAAGMIFFVLLAIFPAMTALVCLYGLFADPKAVADHAAMLARLMPGGRMDILKDQIVRIAANGEQKLGFGLAFGLAISLWSANRGMKALFYVLNVAYGEKESRNYIRLTLVTLGFTISTLALVMAVISAVFLLPSILRLADPSADNDPLIQMIRWPLLLVIAIPFLATIYRYGPSRRRDRWRWVTWGGAFAAVAWLLVSLTFSYYFDRIGTYDKIYGSLGAAIGFMTWIWISVMVVLLGAELNAELERQTALYGNP